MNHRMFRALVWKEWRETRLKWMIFLAVFHLPVIVVFGKLGLDGSLQSQLFTTANDQNIRRSLLDMLVFQELFTLVIGLFLIAFYASSLTASELANRRLLFLLDLPVKRSEILRTKFLVGTLQVLTYLSIPGFLLITLLYFVALLKAGGVTVAGSWVEWLRAAATAPAAMLVTGSFGMLAFSFSFLLTLWFERWWIAVAAAGACLVALLITMLDELHDSLVFILLRQASSSDRVELIWPLCISALLGFFSFYVVSQHVFERKELI